MRDPQAQRDAKKRWYDDHREVYLDRNRRKRADLMQEVRKAKERPCADCGGEFPYYVMDFDHRDGESKLFDVSKGMLSLGRAKVLAEIDKCDVICANCHRIRTATRGGWAQVV
jgi:ubiquinone/menaquinone biosynthesis C-methylase UbiE